MLTTVTAVANPNPAHAGNAAYAPKIISQHLSALRATQTGTSEDRSCDKKADLIKDGPSEPLYDASFALSLSVSRPLIHQEVHQVAIRSLGRLPTVRLVITT